VPLLNPLLADCRAKLKLVSLKICRIDRRTGYNQLVREICRQSSSLSFIVTPAGRSAASRSRSRVYWNVRLPSFLPAPLHFRSARRSYVTTTGCDFVELPARFLCRLSVSGPIARCVYVRHQISLIR